VEYGIDGGRELLEYEDGEKVEKESLFSYAQTVYSP